MNMAKAICLVTALLCSGCQFSPNPSKLRWPWKKEAPAPYPERVVAVWTDTVLHQTRMPGVRGFGGRVYFYEKDATDPIEVDGGLAVYVFDADKLQSHDQRPLRKFVFTPEQFATHMSRTSLGPSYSIWLPWGEVGGPPRRLSLIVRYEGSSGGTTISEPTIKMLPGVPKQSVDSEQDLARQSNASPIQLVGHSQAPNTNEGDKGHDKGEDEKSAEQINRRSRDIKTIDLPPSFQRHWQHSNSSTESMGVAPQQLETNEATPTLTPSATSNQSDNRQLNPNSAGEPNLGTAAMIESDALRSMTAAVAPTPVTTQVIDHRTRTQQRFAGNGYGGDQRPLNTTFATSRLDIRQGRWIESLPRIGRRQ